MQTFFCKVPRNDSPSTEAVLQALCFRKKHDNKNISGGALVQKTLCNLVSFWRFSGIQEAEVSFVTCLSGREMLITSASNEILVREWLTSLDSSTSDHR